MDEFERLMAHRWDMDLWFGNGVDSRLKHPEQMDWLIPSWEDVTRLKWATRHE
ncbi:hypothetical protein Q7F20_09265 [Curtobacterium sp. A7_M15]|uniref:hypothetical protein n=1 Tax=Curtobacterium sp. A7_M15 TaxID=3065241 RepID=UPI002737ADB4|nr:hypothetical protein [Curtobacterium sp. A7_M15]MDP4333560.1 hypothetical protein [Curtobacterium sp. A7_M15]